MEQQELVQMKTQLTKLDNKVDRVIEMLSGNEYDKNDNGLTGEVRQLNIRVAKLEKWKDRVIYVLVGASFVAGWTIPDILQKIFLHK